MQKGDNLWNIIKKNLNELNQHVNITNNYKETPQNGFIAMIYSPLDN